MWRYIGPDALRSFVRIAAAFKAKVDTFKAEASARHASADAAHATIHASRAAARVTMPTKPIKLAITPSS